MHWPLVLAALLAVPAPGPEPVAAACDMPAFDEIGPLHNFLGMRAVEIVDRASRPEWEADERLRRLVSPHATFGLGAGDVGRPLAGGVAGAHALAMQMKADSYRFLGWDYFPMPIEKCSSHEIMVEFIDSAGSNGAAVTFTFEAGRLVKADGWHRSFHSGAIRGIRAGE